MRIVRLRVDNIGCFCITSTLTCKQELFPLSSLKAFAFGGEETRHSTQLKPLSFPPPTVWVSVVCTFKELLPFFVLISNEIEDESRELFRFMSLDGQLFAFITLKTLTLNFASPPRSTVNAHLRI